MQNLRNSVDAVKNGPEVVSPGWATAPRAACSRKSAKTRSFLAVDARSSGVFCCPFFAPLSAPLLSSSFADARPPPRAAQ